MNLLQTIFFLPCAMCFLCWSQINNFPTSTQRCDLCAISYIEASKYGSSFSSTVKMCALYNSECDTLCHDSIKLIAIMDSSINVTSCKATCCQTDLCNNDALLNNVPYYNGDMQSTGNKNTLPNNVPYYNGDMQSTGNKNTLPNNVPYYNGDMQSTGNNNVLLNNVPYHNGAMQSNGMTFLYWKIFIGILFVSLGQKCLL
ncbi:uncharacterized protein LOC105843440 isoform X2 [Hydra vulgaris]|uniref:Uncharacterized protein LOC105843440 isoform X2 n=1 Tax=Hydra vulgaris TaxID=6087 RepID=A0ABM4B4Y3_HYDVU